MRDDTKKFLQGLAWLSAMGFCIFLWVGFAGAGYGFDISAEHQKKLNFVGAVYVAVLGGKCARRGLGCLK